MKPVIKSIQYSSCGLHPKIVELRDRIRNGPKDKVYDVDLTYITSRGNWYYISWKGDIQKSGGIATNIGIHFFDMLGWIFGEVKNNVVNISEPNKAGGYLELKNARVRWFLSLDYNDIPREVRGNRTRELSDPLQLKVKKLNSVRDLPICIQQPTGRLLRAADSDWMRPVSQL